MSQRWMSLAICLALGACGSPERTEPCTVAQNEDGSATMTCPDGSSASFGAPQEGGQSCTVAQQPDGSAVITCPDGSSATVVGGAGEACVVTHQGEGLYLLTCPDGSTAIFTAIEDEQATPTPPDVTEPPTDPPHHTPDPTDPPEATQGPEVTPTPEPEATPTSDPATTPAPTNAPGPVVCEGDFSVASQAEIEVLSECGEITGNLHVGGSLRTVEGLEGLQRIGGNLEVVYAGLVSTEGLRGLESIGGRIDLEGVSGLNRAEFASLESVVAVDLERMPADFTLVIPSLRSPLELNFSTTPVYLTLEGRGTLEVGTLWMSQEKLEVFRLRGVEHIVGDLTFMPGGTTQPYALSEVDLGDVAQIDGDLTLQRSNVLRLVAPALEAVGGLSLGYLARLTELSLPSLTHVRGILSIGYNYELSHLSLPLLAGVAGAFYITDNTRLPACEVDAIVSQVQSAEGIQGNVINTGNTGSGTCD